jgi:hypothetical protein
VGLRQVQQHDVAGGSLDQGPDRGLVRRAGDQVALPVARHSAVGHLSRAFADVDHVRDPAAALCGLAVRPAQRSTGAQASRQVSSQRAASLHIQALVDGLVRHPHLHLGGEVQQQTPADLLGAVLQQQPLLHMFTQPVVARQQRDLRPPGPGVGSRLGDGSPVPALAAHRPPAQLPADRRRRAAQCTGDHPDSVPSGPAASDLLALGDSQPERQRPSVRSGFNGRHHPASVSEPPPRNRPRHAHGVRCIAGDLARPDQRPVLPLNLHPNRWAPQDHAPHLSGKVLR